MISLTSDVGLRCQTKVFADLYDYNHMLNHSNAIIGQKKHFWNH